MNADHSPLISVIMPVYKVEPYLPSAVESVLEQTFQDFELILVDDESPDNCPALCDEYARQYEQVQVLHKPKNGGLGAARNTGAAVARGRYLYYMDSDDWIDKDLFERVNASIQSYPANVIMIGLLEEYYENGVLKRTIPVTVPGWTAKTAKEVHKKVAALERAGLYGYAWNKFYSREHIQAQQLSFSSVTLIEDIEFNVRFFESIDSCTYLDCTPYHYAKRMKGSLTDKFVADYFSLHETRIRMVKEQLERWGEYKGKSREILGELYLRYFYSAICRNRQKESGMSRKDQKAWVQARFQDALFRDILRGVRPSERILRWMLYPARKRWAGGCLALGTVMYAAKHKSPVLFAKMKQTGRQ